MKKLVFKSDKLNFPFYILEDEIVISENIEKTGVWENNQLVWYYDLIGSQGIFIDVGANVGINSIYAATRMPDCNVYSIEACKSNYDILIQNINLNSISNVKPFQIALDSKNGFVTFSGTGTNAKISQHDDSGEKVTAVQLDEFCKDQFIETIDLLKIDVEGWTDDVLKGACNALSICKNAIIEFSIEDTMNRYNCDFSEVDSLYCKTIKNLSEIFPFIFYISRSDGLVRLQDFSDYFHLVQLEQNVGDILFSKQKYACLSSVSFLSKKIKELMMENHYRIVEIQRLNGAS